MSLGLVIGALLGAIIPLIITYIFIVGVMGDKESDKEYGISIVDKIRWGLICASVWYLYFVFMAEELDPIVPPVKGDFAGYAILFIVFNFFYAMFSARHKCDGCGKWETMMDKGSEYSGKSKVTTYVCSECGHTKAIKSSTRDGGPIDGDGGGGDGGGN